MKKDKTKNKNQLIYTIKDRCKVCYTCVRECPAKAVKIMYGQAEILPERCILCGNCVKVCSRKAKMFTFSIDEVKKLLDSSQPVVALIAPSIAGEFTDISNYRHFVGMVRALGFTYVNEVAFGAELVADKYKELLNNISGKTYISTSCPALVSYVEKHHPQIVDSLAPIASPMIAIAKVLREIHGDSVKIVFIGPCIAKKGEAAQEQFKGLIDEVISFVELRMMFEKQNITEFNVKSSAFDPPNSGKGSVFPISGGMLQTVDLNEDFMNGEIVVAEGRQEIIEVLKEYEEGHLEAKLFDLLCCNGCINGPGMSHNHQIFNKRKNISNYAKRRFDKLNIDQWKKDIEHYSKLELSRKYHPEDQSFSKKTTDGQIEKILKKLGKYNPDDELNCGACGYDNCRDHAIAMINGIAESEMCLPYTIEKLHEYIDELALSHKKLDYTQTALKQSEKLASMGQLAAGIAHEVNNPLGVVIMYSHILLDEVPQESPLHNDLKMIVEQANRCKKIVGGLLNFARKSKVSLTKVNAEDLIKNSFQGFVLPENINFSIEMKTNKPLLDCDYDQMIQGFSNLFKNAADAMPKGGKLTVKVKDGEDDSIMFIIKDTGTGISKENAEVIFEPFFTTKEKGKGTGLGLPIIYGIVKMHNGKIDVKSNNDPEKGPTGTSFFVTLPRKSKVKSESDKTEDNSE